MRKILGLIGIVLICVISFGTFFGLARGTLNNIAGFDFQTVNESNYIKVDDYVIKSTEEGADVDVKVSVDDDGIITLEGKNSHEGSSQIQVTTVTLEKGEYEFVSHAKGCSDETYQLVLKSTTGEIIADETFTVEETTKKGPFSF